MVTNLKDPIFSKGIRTKATILLNAEAFVIVPEKLIDFIKKLFIEWLKFEPDCNKINGLDI